MASELPATLAGQLAPEGSSDRRLRDARYESPSGVEIKLTYESVSRDTPLRGSAYNFPGINEAYVQRMGFGSRQYPMRCFFNGQNHDRIASAFEDALFEHGEGVLEHPRYGKLTVVPFGTVTRRDDLKSQVNQSIVEVTFWTTTGVAYPQAELSPRNEILAAIEGFDVAAAQQFEDTTDLSRAVDQATLRGTVTAALQAISGALRSVSDATADARSDYAETEVLINSGLNVLVGQPLQLAQQLSNLAKAPARSRAAIGSRLRGYRDTANRMFRSRGGSSANDGAALDRVRRRVVNDFHLTDLLALNTVAGSALSVVEHEFSTKPEAMGAAEDVMGQIEGAITWRDGRFQGLDLIDPGASYQALQQIVALVAGYLVEVSFTLVPERRIVLDRPRTVVDLASELYGAVDRRLDFLIESNSLSGDEILELPRGRTILYYPEPQSV